MPRPRGGDLLIDEVRAWKAAGVQVVVSALEPMEEAYLDLQEEEATCERLGITFRRFSLLDRSTPSVDSEASAFVQDLARLLQEGTKIVIHCRLGIGRSGMLCAATLVGLGHDPSDAFLRVQTARGMRVPDTREQMEWVFDLAPRLGRSP
jgi:protein-tyrosine phosphatase